MRDFGILRTEQPFRAPQTPLHHILFRSLSDETHDVFFTSAQCAFFRQLHNHNSRFSCTFILQE